MPNDLKFSIADTFKSSLSRLANDEKKAAKSAALDLQINPSRPNRRFHRLEMVSDKNFWSLRVGGDLRIIVHRSGGNMILCYVGHHDKAYAWAQRRKLTRSNGRRRRL